MSDTPQENSPEQVAYQLMRDILLNLESRNIKEITRDEYLDTYAECFQAVKGRRPLPKTREQTRSAFGSV